MALNQKITGAMQENLISLLAHDEEHGRVVSRLVDASLFEGDYQTVADRCITYWRKYDCPPGPHAADLFADILEDPHNRKAGTYRRALQSMRSLHDAGINAEYVVQEVSNFRRGVQIKAAILRSAEMINADQEMAIGEVEGLWNRILRVREITFNPGMTLDQYDRVLENLARRQVEFTTGVEQLDRAGVVPYRGALMMLVARAKGGKSWWLTSLGKQALELRKKVCHVSLEMSEELNLQRYYQALWSITTREAREGVEAARFGFKDEPGKAPRLVKIGRQTVRPKSYFKSSMIADELRARVEERAGRARNLRVKRFPPRSLTPDGLRGYLDNLELATGFIPDMLILDYASLMKTDAKNHRIELGRNVEELRAIAVERNIAVVSAHQSNREGARAKVVRSTDVGEDWSVVQTADTILTFSSTAAEKRLGLGRLYVANARDTEDEWGLVVAQGIKFGQFCLSSARLNDDYFDMVKESEEEEDDDGD